MNGCPKTLLLGSKRSVNSSPSPVISVGSSCSPSLLPRSSHIFRIKVPTVSPVVEGSNIISNNKHDNYLSNCQTSTPSLGPAIFPAHEQLLQNQAMLHSASELPSTSSGFTSGATSIQPLMVDTQVQSTPVHLQNQLPFYSQVTPDYLLESSRAL